MFLNPFIMLFSQFTILVHLLLFQVDLLSFHSQHVQQIPILCAIPEIPETVLTRSALVEELHARPGQRSNQHHSTIRLHAQRKRSPAHQQRIIDCIENIRTIIVVRFAQQILVPIVARLPVQRIVVEFAGVRLPEAAKRWRMHGLAVHAFGESTAREQRRFVGDLVDKNGENVLLFELADFRLGGENVAARTGDECRMLRRGCRRGYTRTSRRSNHAHHLNVVHFGDIARQRKLGQQAGLQHVRTGRRQ